MISKHTYGILVSLTSKYKDPFTLGSLFTNQSTLHQKSNPYCYLQARRHFMILIYTNVNKCTRFWLRSFNEVSGKARKRRRNEFLYKYEEFRIKMKLGKQFKSKRVNHSSFQVPR